jgi:DNA-binding transcriptional LysR family regulator
MTPRWSLDDLRVFCAVADSGTLTAAAQAAALSLPAVSARLKALEAAFGTALCVRSNKGVELTPAGNRLLAHARDLLEKAALATDDVAEFGSQPRGLIRIAANTTAVTEHLPEVIGAFLKTHPRLDVALVECVSADVLRQVREARADIGIYTPGPTTADLECFEFREDELVLVVGSAHPWAHRASIAFHETLAADHVCLQRGAALFQFLGQRARDQGRTLKGRIHVAGFDAVARLVGQGVGVAVMPKSAASRLQAERNIALVALTEAWADNPLHLCVRAIDELSPGARALVEALAPTARRPRRSLPPAALRRG